MPRTALKKPVKRPRRPRRASCAAEEVFAAKGFDGASTREIAAAAGVNISSLHYHWESKETLYFAVFQNIYDRIVELVRSSIPASPADRPRQPRGDRRGDGSAVRLLRRPSERPEAAWCAVCWSRREHAARSSATSWCPAWRLFAAWTNELQRAAAQRGADAQIFMLTVHSVLLLFLLDSQQFVSLLGGSVALARHCGRGSRAVHHPSGAQAVERQ